MGRLDDKGYHVLPVKRPDTKARWDDKDLMAGPRAERSRCGSPTMNLKVSA